MRFSHIITNILSGPLRNNAQGFLVLLPKGCHGKTTMAQCLHDHYHNLAHPDLLTIEDLEKNTIKIEQVRNAASFLSTRPMAQNGMKTVWVPQCDTMTNQAANAFLKSLEEPTPSTRIIMGTDSLEKILPTIRSRCLIFSAIDDTELAIRELDERIEKAKPTDKELCLSITHHQVDAASNILQAKGGVAWLKSVVKAFEEKTTLPLAPTGKDGISTLTCLLVIQSLIATRMRAGDEQAAAMEDALQPFHMGAERSGLDTNTRIASALHAVSAAMKKP